MTTTRLSSWVLLGGVLGGFLLASWQGHSASTYSKPAGFKRFHQRISIDALYYPPYAMLETLALARWQPGRTLVIIGGNSILNGVGQPEDEVWSQRLQEQLGDSYVVVNLAFRGANPAQGAALVAESLLARGLPVIYVANTNPTAGLGLAAVPPYGYLYWQARYQGRLTAYPARDEAFNRWQEQQPRQAQGPLAEERLGARFEPWTRHQSLWHHIGYRHGFTVWSGLLAKNFWVPRDRLADNEPRAQPLENRFQHALTEELALVRVYTSGLATTGADGRWQLSAPGRKWLEDDIEASFVPALRPHTLMLLDENATYYLERLSPTEQERDRLIYAAYAQVWRDHGIACEVTGAGFTATDYIDRAHLSGDGGLKLAFFVAQKIKQLHPR